MSSPDSTQDYEPGGPPPPDEPSETQPGDHESGSHGSGGGADGSSRGEPTRFRVLGLHQKGGLGQVMLAEDRELPRQVALKEIQPQFADNPLSRERFVLEAEITGGLEHPGIVPVYGLGKYADGRPYYAMRFIRGDNLGKAIERFHGEETGWKLGERSVAVQRLLRRFSDVCNAVQYAHSRGVLHRDLKPGNVMLGRYGETLVVDWGLAKLVGRPEAERSPDETTLRLSSGNDSHLTIQGSTVGTPAYMSPEQAAGEIEQLGPASDVYSLGATLYCVLTGQVPFKGRERILERVKAGEFPTPRTVQPQVPRALEAICLKAMRRTPDERYESPRKLVEDLEHWLADEPVSVYRGSRSERAARWARRHRAWVQAGVFSLVAIALVSAAAALLVWQAWQREATAWNTAATNFVQAREAVDRWVTGVGEALAYYPVASNTRAVLLEQAAEEYERFVRSQPGDLELELERGRTYLRLGHLRLLLRDAPRAAEAYRQAAAVFDALAVRAPERLDCRMERANCETNLGVLAMETNQLPAADQHLQAATGRLLPLAQLHPNETAVRDSLAVALVSRGELLADTGRSPEAEQVLRESLQWLSGRPAASERAPGQAAAARASREEREREQTRRAADAHDLLGRVLLDQGRYEAALAELNAAVRLAAQLVRLQPDHPPYLETLAAAHITSAVVLRELGRADEEAEAYRQAIDGYRALCAALPGIAKYEESLAISLLDRGSLLYQLGQVKEAEADLNEARTLAERLQEENPQFAGCRDTWACCLDRLAELLRDRGEFDKSEALLREAIRTYEELVGDTQAGAPEGRVVYLQSLAVCQSHLGQTLQQLGRGAEAEQAFAAALEGLAGLAADSPRAQDQQAAVHRQRGELRHELGRQEDAATDFRQAREVWQQLIGTENAAPEHRAHLAWLLVNCPQAELRNPQEAVRLATGLTKDVPGNAEYHTLLGAALVRAGDSERALAALQQADRLRPSEHALDGLFLAMALAQTGKGDEAQEAYQRATRWLERNLPKHAELRRIQREAADVLGVPLPR